MVLRYLLPLVALAILVSYFPSLDATVCWRKPYCYCYEGYKPSIYCRYVKNVSDVLPLFRKYTPIYRIRLHGYFRTLPESPPAFDGISVIVLALTAPLSSNIPDNALQGVRNLRNIVLNGTAFSHIPTAFVSTQTGLQSIESVSGNLIEIGTELQNLSLCREIILYRNRISKVSGQAFAGSTKVQKLDLSRNELTHLDQETFVPMTFLEVIDLSYNHLHSVDGFFNTLDPRTINLYGNNLTSVDELCHEGMWNLKYLNLGGNPGLHLTDCTFNASLDSLTDLHLSGCNIDRLDTSLLRNMGSLRYLYLNNNNLSSIPKYFLEHTPSVTTLELSNNRLKTMEGVLDSVKEWYNSLKLKLDGNELANASLGKSRIEVYSVDFSRNQISEIPVEDMRRLTEAVYLNLSRNEIRLLEKECFEGFFSLEHLDISHNPIISFNQTIRDLPKLYHFYARSCMLESLTEEDFWGCARISGVYLANNSLSSVHGAFKNMKNISYLDISHNNLSTLTVESFPPFQNTSIRVRVLYMADNPWSCDCRMAWFADWVQRKGKKLMDEPICASPTHLQGLRLRELNRTDFEMWMEDCPGTCDCFCRAEGLRTYTDVHCERRELRGVPEVLPFNVRSLDLGGNVIESFDGRGVLGLKELYRLNLENNRIKQVQIILPPKLVSLRLAYNSLHSIPVGEWVNNVSITLSRNPWTCKCDTLAFKNWLVRYNDSILDLNEVRCSSQESFSLRNKPIILLTRKDLCSYFLSIIIISACCALLLIVCLTSCLCCRQSLTACLYFWGCKFLKRSDIHDYPYDAFLMYSEKDEDLALTEIARGLETHSFLLCIPTRDIASPLTPQKVEAYLPQCTKVIVLMTRNFLDNQECMRLLLHAMSFSTESSSKRIIFVTRGDLSHVNELDPALRILLKSCTLLRWGECFFWQKLIYQLPKKQNKDERYEDVEEQQPLME